MDRDSLRIMAFTTSFRDLEVWQESMTLVEEVYTISKSFPRDELFGLTAQVRKAVVSIPSNIGEGARRKKQRVTLNHYDRLGFTRGSGGSDRSRKAARLLQRIRLRSSSRAR